MKNSTWKDTAELIGIVAIVASLIFVGLQVRQETLATRSATVLQLKDSWVQLNLATATSVDLADALYAVQSDGLNDSDHRSRSLVTGFYRTLFHNWSNAYYQFNNGTLDEEQWASHFRELERLKTDQIALEIWTHWNYVYDDSFRVMVNRIVEEEDKKK